MHEHTLENGLKTYIVEDHRAPVVVNFVWYPIGAADEIPGKTGIAHMLEHLMFKGTEDIPPQEFSKIVARYGGKDNAFTSYDYTAYYQKIGRNHLEKMMQLEASRMRGLTFGRKEFEPERNVVTEERRQRIGTNPTARFYEKLMHVHFPDHPYGRPVIGWMEDIQNYKVDDARAWYDTYYQPGRAIVLVVGDVTPDEVIPMLENTYGQLDAGEVIDRPIWNIQPRQKKTKWLKEVDAQATVPLGVIIYRAPSYFGGVAGENVPEEDILPLALLAQVLGGGTTSLLYEAFVKEQKIAVSASASYNPYSRAESSLDIFLKPAPEVTLSDIHDAYDAVVKNFLKKGVDPEHLARIKTTFLASDVYARDDMFMTAYRLGLWLTLGGTTDTFDAWMAKLENVSVADVMRVARTYLVAPDTVGYLAASENLF